MFITSHRRHYRLLRARHRRTGTCNDVTQRVIGVPRGSPRRRRRYLPVSRILIVNLAIAAILSSSEQTEQTGRQS